MAAEQIGSDIGLTHTAVRKWLTLLETSYVAFVLEPFHKNCTGTMEITM
jgi:hypothetical protein